MVGGADGGEGGQQYEHVHYLTSVVVALCGATDAATMAKDATSVSTDVDAGVNTISLAEMGDTETNIQTRAQRPGIYCGTN